MSASAEQAKGAARVERRPLDGGKSSEEIQEDRVNLSLLLTHTFPTPLATIDLRRLRLNLL